MELKQEKIIREVKAYVRNAHLKQTRKFGADKDKSYFDTHITRVAESVAVIGNFDKIVAAWLHDTKEDQIEWWNPKALLTMGVTKNALDIVDHLSKLEGENYLNFTLRVMKKPEAILVKMKDLSDNMKDLKKGSMLDKYSLASYILGKEYNSIEWVEWSRKNGND